MQQRRLPGVVETQEQQLRVLVRQSERRKDIPNCTRGRQFGSLDFLSFHVAAKLTKMLGGKGRRRDEGGRESIHQFIIHMFAVCLVFTVGGDVYCSFLTVDIPPYSGGGRCRCRPLLAVAVGSGCVM